MRSKYLHKIFFVMFGVKIELVECYRGINYDITIINLCYRYINEKLIIEQPMPLKGAP